MTNENKRSRIDFLRERHKSLSQREQRYDIGGQFYDREEILELLGDIAKSDMPRQFTDGVGKMKYHILEGRDLSLCIDRIRNAYSEYIRQNAQGQEGEHDRRK